MKPYLILNDETNEIVSQCNTFAEALHRAKKERSATGHHHIIYKVEFCGGTKTLADLDNTTTGR
jgi:hypothetical protein